MHGNMNVKGARLIQATKVKVNLTLEQAVKVQKRSTGIALSFL
jgi:hypothetical protein